MSCTPIEALRALAMLGLAFACSSGTAQPALIYDQGPARPLSDYVEPLPVLATPSPKAPVHLAVPAPAFPLRTAGLSPGAVASRPVAMPKLATAPFFLVGSDAFSLEWLVRQSARLAAMGAVGFLVEADSEADWQAVKRMAPGVPMTPLEVGELATSLGLEHYPVLVASGQVWQ